jgi:hypothetical protein
MTATVKNAIQNARTPKPALAVAGWNPEQKMATLVAMSFI